MLHKLPEGLLAVVQLGLVAGHALPVSYTHLVTDPKGQLLSEVGTMLRRGAPKLDENGKPLRDARGKVIYEPYRIKVLNTINFKKSMKYNPFAYIRSEKDILKLVNVIIANTKGARPDRA